MVIQAVVGVATVAAAFIAARRGAKEVDRRAGATDERTRREEWFRRFTWAAEARNSTNQASQTVGETVLQALYSSTLATDEERELVVLVQYAALNVPRPRSTPA